MLVDSDTLEEGYREETSFGFRGGLQLLHDRFSNTGSLVLRLHCPPLTGQQSAVGHQHKFVGQSWPNLNSRWSCNSVKINWSHGKICLSFIRVWPGPTCTDWSVQPVSRTDLENLKEMLSSFSQLFITTLMEMPTVLRAYLKIPLCLTDLVHYPVIWQTV